MGGWVKSRGSGVIARTLASSPEVEGIAGRYFVRRRETSPGAQARDPAAARRLWALSEELVGLSV